MTHEFRRECDYVT